MIDKKFWKNVFFQQTELDTSRWEVIAASAKAQHLAKQAIFAMQRDNLAEAKEKLAGAKNILVDMDQKFGQEFRLRGEGSWKASVEEFVEAKLFMDFCQDEELDEIKEFKVEFDEYIGGLSDVCGEIVRKMISLTTTNKFNEVKKANEAINDIIHELMQVNFTGYLRTKFDQAKKHLQKSESIIYDIAIREKK